MIKGSWNCQLVDWPFLGPVGASSGILMMWDKRIVERVDKVVENFSLSCKFWVCTGFKQAFHRGLWAKYWLSFLDCAYIIRILKKKNQILGWDLKFRFLFFEVKQTFFIGKLHTPIGSWTHKLTFHFIIMEEWSASWASLAKTNFLFFKNLDFRLFSLDPGDLGYLK